MFKVHTTIVLGAGASHSYGYPLGDSLIDQLSDLCKPRDIGDKYGYLETISPSIRLYESLRFYDPMSIDAFLMHYKDNKELIEIAKKFICQIILTSPKEVLFERGAALSLINKKENTDKTNWYRFFWDAIISGLSAEELCDSNTSLNFDVITFNYDNSLEYFLKRSVISDHSIFSQDQQSLFLEKLKDRIHHVYGALDETTLVPSFGLDFKNLSHLFFDKNNAESRAARMSQNIRLINERSEADYSHIQNVLQKNRSQIIFLGFGFDDINIGPKVLNLEEVLKSTKASKQSGAEYLPVVKYTNLNNSENINRKIEKLLYQHVYDEGSGFVNRKSSAGIIKSEKKVYQAIEQDFSLTDF